MKRTFYLLISGCLLFSIISLNNCNKKEEKKLPALITLSVSGIATNSAILGGFIPDDGGAKVTARGVCWGVATNPAISGYKTTDGTGIGPFTSSLRGLHPNTLYFARAYATNSEGTAYGNEESFTTDQLIDADGNEYSTVIIGTQVWMVENLKTTKLNDSTPIPNVTDPVTWGALITTGYSWYYNDASTYEAAYGALYNWYTIKTGKLCPTGWHVPAKSEWETLIIYLGGANLAGGKMKEVNTGSWMRPNVGATNESGFTGLPGSWRRDSGEWGPFGYDSHWWSTTEYDVVSAWGNELSFNTTLSRVSFIFKKNGCSVRCVKD